MAARKTSGKELLTLREVGERTGISMPTLLRYKKQHQARIPSVGEGRRQRYPVAALGVFEAIKRENVGRRGRPTPEPLRSSVSALAEELDHLGAYLRRDR